MITFKFFVDREGSGRQGDQLVLGDPYKTQENPAVHACDVTLGSGPSRAIFGGTPLGAVANAMTFAHALVESQGKVSWP